MKFPVKFTLSFILFVTFCATGFAQQVSDSSIKTNTAPVANSLNYITRLQPVSYEYKRGEYKQLNLPAGKQFGFIANDAKLIVPSAVSNHHNWYTAGKGSQRTITTSEVDLEKLVPFLVGAIKEQQAEIEKLKQEVQKLQQSR